MDTKREVIASEPIVRITLELPEGKATELAAAIIGGFRWSDHARVEDELRQLHDALTGMP